MICPLCTNTNLQAVIRDGIQIDVCPRCHGMWLDRGELSQLMAADPISTLSAPIPADRYDPTAFGDEGRPAPPLHVDEHRRRSKDEKRRKKNKQRGKKSSKRKPHSWSRRLGELIEDVIDELD